MDFLAMANRMKVTPELLGEVLEMHANLPPEDRPVHEVRMIRLFQLLDDKGLKDKRGDLAIAIDFRLTALAHMLARQEAPGWTLQGTEKGMEMIHPNLVRCAADQPLIEDENHQVAFEPESFRRRVLEITETSGAA